MTVMAMLIIRIEWLTHRGRVTHICVGNLTIIASDNGLSPGRRQAITWTNVGILLIGPLGTNFSEILIEIHTFSSGKWRTFCLGLNVLMMQSIHDAAHMAGWPAKKVFKPKAYWCPELSQLRVRKRFWWAIWKEVKKIFRKTSKKIALGQEKIVRIPRGRRHIYDLYQCVHLLMICCNILALSGQMCSSVLMPRYVSIPYGTRVYFINRSIYHPSPIGCFFASGTNLWNVSCDGMEPTDNAMFSCAERYEAGQYLISNHINMMTSSNGKIFRVTGPFCGEFTGHQWIPRTKVSDTELWCFLWSALE